MKQNRLDAVLAHLGDMGLSQMLITDPLSIFYLTGRMIQPLERFYGLYLNQNGGHRIFINLLETVPEDLGVEKVRLTGGEPLEQASFLKNFIPACKEHKIHVAMESCMFIWDKNIFSQADYLMSDLKIWDNEKHIRFTGVSNAKIKENILKADELGIPILLRTPVVKGINDTKEEIQNIRNFAKSLKHVVGYELLPYHPLGIPKRKALGMPVEEFSQPEKEIMETLKKYADL